MEWATHFDAIEVGLTAGLEIGVLEFPDLSVSSALWSRAKHTTHILLDLPRLFIDVLDLTH